MSSTIDSMQSPEPSGFIDQDELSNSTNGQSPIGPGQIKRIATKFQKMKAPEFRYQYKDTDSLEQELEEWFAYSDDVYLAESMELFHKTLADSWRRLSNTRKERYVESQISLINSGKSSHDALLKLFYFALGVFKETTDQRDQLSVIVDSAYLIWKCKGLDCLYATIRRLIDEIYKYDPEDSQSLSGLRKELFLSLTVFYIVINVADGEDFSDDLNDLQPPALPYFIKQISEFRLTVAEDLPWRNIFLITWKLILRILGTSADLVSVKEYARSQAGLPHEPKKDVISASPLDYQAFRQGISSRYPAYRPPVSSVPKEFELMLSASSSKVDLTDYVADPLPGSSVHIATPAPSPPPSPPPLGKSKKSSFQTDKTVPFLYPQNLEIPASIKEAEEIFAQKMRTSLGILQLWEEREEFMKEERGWVPASEVIIKSLEMTGTYNEKLAKKLQRIEGLYEQTLEYLQGFVVITLKLVLSTVSLENSENIFIQQIRHSNDSPVKAELESARESEIMLKGISAILYLLLKWFKVSHILKFEYFCQILYDSNALPLFLQLFNTKEIEQFVLQMPEVPELRFFNICRTLADGKPLPEKDILVMNYNRNSENLDEILQQPEITEFSSRNFFVSINFLKIMQKICKNKAHRNLMIVQLKASNSLRKTLRISQYEARLYALKIIKGQVPYCGRKWRHVNMRVITAIYLYCRQELRDSWLAGVDIDADIEDSYPREVALRALIQFYNTRRYPAAAIALGYQSSEDDFFTKELDNLLLEDKMSYEV
ncbi:hypothetical protein V1511DRAFT_492357 [Dipodascopsis uninucleata]